jgi:hypothetical protein
MDELPVTHNNHEAIDHLFHHQKPRRRLSPATAGHVPLTAFSPMERARQNPALSRNRSPFLFCGSAAQSLVRLCR